MTVRQKFLESYRVLWLAVEDPVVQHRQPFHVDANQKGQLFRSSIAVSTFTAMEQFLIDRVVELTCKLEPSVIQFVSLPEKFRETVVLNSVQAMFSHLSRMRKRGDDWLTECQRQAMLLASTSTASYQLPTLFFGFGASNLGAGDVRDVLGLFGVDGGWAAVTRFAARVGASTLPADAAFSACAMRRHSAAHSSSSNIPVVDLQEGLKASLAICLSFDILMSSAVARLLARDLDLSAGKKVDVAKSLRIAFIESQGSRFKLIHENASRASRIVNTTEEAKRIARSSTKPCDVLIVRSAHKMIEDWDSRV